MDDVQDRLTEIRALVEGARAMPMSASCVVNRSELLALLDDLESQLPASLVQAHHVLADRSAVVDDGRREAERIVAEAQAERRRLLSTTDLYQEAHAEASAMLDEARTQAQAMRLEVEDYVDGKLANFEIVLTKTLQAVERGRQKLLLTAGEMPELAELSHPDYDGAAAP